MSTNPNDRQVGGSHYQANMQHWDLVEDFQVAYLEGVASKYLTRHKKKNGLEDLRKAEHYVDKLISLVEQGRRQTYRGYVPAPVIKAFCQDNQLYGVEYACLLGLFQWTHIDQLKYVKRLIGDLIFDAEGQQGCGCGKEH